MDHRNVSGCGGTNHDLSLPSPPPAAPVPAGGGHTGPWTAYHLKKTVPFLNITVLEGKFCGYGVSGRNGGRLYNGIAGRDRYARLPCRTAMSPPYASSRP